MKKPKISFSKEALRGFFTHHVEKLVLGVVVILVALFVMWGYQVEGFGDRTPDVLSRDVASTRTHITTTNPWPELQEQKERSVTDITQRLRKREGKLPPIPADVYPPPAVVMSPPIAPLQDKRRDPDLFPPVKLEVRTGYGPLATRPTSGDALREDKLLQAAAAAVAAVDPTRPAVAPAPGGFGSSRTLSPEQLEYIDGYRGATGDLPVGVYYVAVTALVPYRKQWDEFELALKDATGYEPARDTPQYLFFYVERAEVDAASGQPGAWQAIGNSSSLQRAMVQWSGVISEIVDPDFYEEKLTSPIPPIMLRDVTRMALHSESPLIQPDDFDAEPLAPMAQGDGPDLPDSPMDLTSRVPGEGVFGPGQRGRLEGAPQPGSPDYVPPQYKLFRYFDLSARPGSQYIYRVKFLIHDPNRPNLAATAAGGLTRNTAITDPLISQLDETVVARLRDVEAAELRMKATRPDYRQYWRETEWSQPSPIAELPQTWRLLAGETKVDPPIEIRELDMKIPKLFAEPSGKALAVLWDQRFAADVPGELDIFRGSVLNFTKDADVLHSASLQVVTAPQYQFQTDAVVLDIRGGEALPGKDRKNPQKAPGEILFVDSQGRLLVQDELDDKLDYRLNTFEAPPEFAPGGPIDPVLAPGGRGLPPGAAREFEGVFPGEPPGGRPPRGRPPGGARPGRQE